MTAFTRVARPEEGERNEGDVPVHSRGHGAGWTSGGVVREQKARLAPLPRGHRAASVAITMELKSFRVESWWNA